MAAMRACVSGTQVNSGLPDRTRYLRGTRERGGGSTRVSECLCVCVCVCVMCLSLFPLPPYPRFVSPLNTVAGRAVSWLPDRKSPLLGTREREGAGARASERERPGETCREGKGQQGVGSQTQTHLQAESQKWDSDALINRQILMDEGPWRGTDMTVVWEELYFQA
jgi:hypothetical protein